MTVREFLDLFTGVPLDTEVVLEDGCDVAGVTYNAEKHFVTIEPEYDEDYFTDEGEDDEDEKTGRRQDEWEDEHPEHTQGGN